jgi:hypothetical protein
VKPHEKRSYLYFRTSLEMHGYETKKASLSTWTAAGHGLTVTVVVVKRHRVRVTVEGCGTYTLGSVEAVIGDLVSFARMRDEQRSVAVEQRVKS